MPAIYQTPPRSRGIDQVAQRDARHRTNGAVLAPLVHSIPSAVCRAVVSGFRWEWLFAGVFAALFLIAPARMALWDRREDRIACSVADSLSNGRWMVPYTQEFPRFQKPPLAHWLGAMSVGIFSGGGDYSEMALRLPSCLAAFGTALLLYHLGRLIAGAKDGPRWARSSSEGRWCGLLAVLTFGTNFLVLSEMWVASTEPPLTFFTTLALTLMALHRQAWQSGDTPFRQRLWVVGAGLAVGMGGLCKGPIGLVVPLLPLLALVLASRFGQGQHPLSRSSDPRKTESGYPVVFILVTLLTLGTLPIFLWGAYVLSHYPEAWSIWFHELGSKLMAEWRPPLVTKFFFMATPWNFITLGGLLLPWMAPRHWDRPLLWMVWSWCVANLAMFSLWSGAREPYFLCCMPAVALLGSGFLVATIEGRSQRTWGGLVFRVLCDMQWIEIAIVALVIPGLALHFAPTRWDLIAGASIAALLGAMAAVRFWSRRWQAESWPYLASPLAAAVIGVSLLFCAEWAEQNSHRTPARVAESWAAELQLPLCYLNDTGDWRRVTADAPDVDESYWFYLSQPPQWVGDFEQLADKLAATQQVLLVVSARQRELLQSDPRFEVQTLDKHQTSRWQSALVLASLSQP